MPSYSPQGHVSRQWKSLPWNSSYKSILNLWAATTTPPPPRGDVQEQQNTEVTAADGITHHTAALSRATPREHVPAPRSTFRSLSASHSLHLRTYEDRLSDMTWAEFLSPPALMSSSTEEGFGSEAGLLGSNPDSSAHRLTALRLNSSCPCSSSVQDAPSSAGWKDKMKQHRRRA